ncbi:MAG: efflux RND transporter periplasmic adaptor subunit [Acidobacteriota bacterium]
MCDRSRLVVPALLGIAVLSACTGRAAAPPPTAAASALTVAVTAAVERPIARFIRVTGTLTAEEQAEVAAETSGRIVSTPVERGTRVAAGNPLVLIAAADTQSQLAEAQANAAQIEAGLGMATGQPFAVDRVPDVVNTKAAYDLAQSDFDRLKTLLDQKVISQSEYERSFANVASARQRFEMARNTASQQVQALQAARARVTRASKALADTVVKAPFAGLVAERLVSIGDFVTPGTKVAVVVRVDPLRVELTVPAQFVSVVGVGRPVSLQVDAYPGRTFTGHVRYISPALSATTRALIVEAVVANPTSELKPGFFATAQIEQAEQSNAVLVPAKAVTTVSGTARVFVAVGDRADERIVTTGQVLDDLVELTTGVKAGEQVILDQGPQLVDGVRIASAKGAARPVAAAVTPATTPAAARK